MRAIKVFHRDQEGQLESALPTRYQLLYERDVQTIPVIGKLMVYLDNKAGMAHAAKMAFDASTWYSDGLRSAEIWRVECHNLYRMPLVLCALDLQSAPNPPDKWTVARFWELIRTGSRREIDMAWGHSLSLVCVVSQEIYSTDWVIPRELLGVLATNTWDVRWCGEKEAS